MRYHHEKSNLKSSQYGKIYMCDHPIYSHCTLYLIRNKGLAVIQQRFNPKNKHTYWNMIDQDLVDKIYLHPKFKELFDERAGKAEDGLYPTITIRQLMWALKMKPLPRERWETCFDRKDI